MRGQISSRLRRSFWALRRCLTTLLLFFRGLLRQRRTGRIGQNCHADDCGKRRPNSLAQNKIVEKRTSHVAILIAESKYFAHTTVHLAWFAVQEQSYSPGRRRYDCRTYKGRRKWIFSAI